MRFSHPHAVLRLRRVEEVDPYSAEAALSSWDSAEREPLPQAVVSPIASDETPGVDRTPGVSRATLGLLEWSPGIVLPTDRIEDSLGQVWEVDGAAMDGLNPFTGNRLGVEVPLIREEG